MLTTFSYGSPKVLMAPEEYSRTAEVTVCGWTVAQGPRARSRCNEITAPCTLGQLAARVAALLSSPCEI